MRRFAKFFVLATVVATLVPMGPRASAQVDEEKLVGVITGTTDTGTAPDPIVHRDVCGSFDQVGIAVSLVRAEPTVRTTTGTVTQAVSHNVGFCTRETLLVGEGRLSPTDAQRAFRGAATEVHGADVSDACIELRIEGGEFQRVGNVAEARITIDAHSKRVADPADCDDWDGATGAEFRETMCGEAVVTATPNPASPNLAQAIVAGTAELRRCPSPV